jgi:hypothetical protein
MIFSSIALVIYTPSPFFATIPVFNTSIVTKVAGVKLSFYLSCFQSDFLELLFSSSAILFFETILRGAVMGEWQYEKRKRNARLSEAVF